MIEGLFFLWANALLTLLALRVRRRLLPGADVFTAALVGILLFVAGANLCLVVLGLVGLLSPIPVGVLVTLLFGLERLLPRGAEGDEQREPMASPGPGLRVVVAVLGGLLAWWGGQTIGSGVSFVVDDLIYHAAIPAWWLRAGSLELPPLTYQAYYPANGELFALWFLVPFGTDAFANLSVFLWLLLVLAAGAVVTRNLQGSPLVAAAVMCCLLVSSEVRYFAGTFSANDLAVTGLGAAALALAWSSSGHVGPRAFLSGVAAGLAVGTKVSLAPLALLLGLYWIVTGRGRAPGTGSGRRVLAYALGLVAFGSFWYVRNLALSGNPFFPAELGPFEGPFTAEAQRKTSLLPFIAEGAGDASFWVEFVRRRLDWPLALGAVAVAGYASGAWAAARERNGAARLYRLLILASGVLFLALFPFQPFSGTNNRPTTDLNDLIRYLTFPFAIGLLLFASWGERRRWLDALLAALALLAAGASSADLVADVWPWIVGGALATGASTWLLFAAGPRLARLAPVLALVAWGAVALFAPRKVDETSKRVLTGGSVLLRPGWAALQHLPDDARVAFLSHHPSSHALYRPAYGATLQLELVPVLWDGSAKLPMHLDWRDRPANWWWEFDAVKETVPFEELAANLSAAGVEYLFVNKWPRIRAARGGTVAWPKARQALAPVSPERRVYGDGVSEIWDVRGISPDEDDGGAGEGEEDR